VIDGGDTEEIDCGRALNIYYFTIEIEIRFSFVPQVTPLSGDQHNHSCHNNILVVLLLEFRELFRVLPVLHNAEWWPTHNILSKYCHYIHDDIITACKSVEGAQIRFWPYKYWLLVVEPIAITVRAYVRVHDAVSIHRTLTRLPVLFSLYSSYVSAAVLFSLSPFMLLLHSNMTLCLNEINSRECGTYVNTWLINVTLHFYLNIVHNNIWFS
jgi:hypothetical protein